MTGQCLKCKRELTPDEIGLHKKLVNRGASEYMCIDCLSQYFDVPITILYEKIEQFKKMGCTLFN